MQASRLSQLLRPAAAFACSKTRETAYCQVTGYPPIRVCSRFTHSNPVFLETIFRSSSGQAGRIEMPAMRISSSAHDRQKNSWLWGILGGLGGAVIVQSALDADGDRIVHAETDNWLDTARLMNYELLPSNPRIDDSQLAKWEKLGFKIDHERSTPDRTFYFLTRVLDKENVRNFLV